MFVFQAVVEVRETRLNFKSIAIRDEVFWSCIRQALNRAAPNLFHAALLRCVEKHVVVSAFFSDPVFIHSPQTREKKRQRQVKNLLQVQRKASFYVSHLFDKITVKHEIRLQVFVFVSDCKKSSKERTM